MNKKQIEQLVAVAFTVGAIIGEQLGNDGEPLTVGEVDVESRKDGSIQILVRGEPIGLELRREESGYRIEQV